MLTQRPELFGAVVSKVPLTDMQRFHKLLAGASWMSEYGDPDNAEDWAALAKYSPFHNVKRGAPYPPMFFTTSTKRRSRSPGPRAQDGREARGARARRRSTTRTSRAVTAAPPTSSRRAYVDALVYTFLCDAPRAQRALRRTRRPCFGRSVTDGERHDAGFGSTSA